MMKEETNAESKAPPKKDHRPSHSNSNNSSAPKSNTPPHLENSSKSDAKLKEKSKDSTKLGKNRKLTTEE